MIFTVVLPRPDGPVAVGVHPLVVAAAVLDVQLVRGEVRRWRAGAYEPLVRLVRLVISLASIIPFVPRMTARRVLHTVDRDKVELSCLTGQAFLCPPLADYRVISDLHQAQMSVCLTEEAFHRAVLGITVSPLVVVADGWSHHVHLDHD